MGNLPPDATVMPRCQDTVVTMLDLWVHLGTDQSMPDQHWTHNTWWDLRAAMVPLAQGLHPPAPKAEPRGRQTP